MEEMPSINMPVQRLKVTILPLDLPCSGPVTHSGEILTTDKSHGLPRVMKYYSPTGRRNHGRPLKRLLDTWDRNGSTSGPTPWKIYDEDDDDDDDLPNTWRGVLFEKLAVPRLVRKLPKFKEARWLTVVHRAVCNYSLSTVRWIPSSLFISIHVRPTIYF